MGLLDGCYLKIERSQEHLDALNQATQRFVQERDQLTFTFLGQANAQRTKYVFRVDEVLVDLPFMEWGIIVGDAVHSLRSALDQMVYTLAADPTGVCAFPICATEKEWVLEAPGMLWSVPEDVQAVIKAAQPYHRGHAAHSDPLAVLRSLSNLDKHRTIPTIALTPVSAEATITKTVGIRSHKLLRVKSGAVLEPDAVIADVAIEADDSGLEPYMDMDSHFMFDVAFGRGPIPSSLYLKPILQTFNDLLGSSTFSILRRVSDIVEPETARPTFITPPI